MTREPDVFVGERALVFSGERAGFLQPLHRPLGTSSIYASSKGNPEALLADRKGKLREAAARRREVKK